ncbi:MAG: hypothetical protein Q7T55_08140 [Solirubrobacteraceae bacterium]|nr:hypothetical protein [Solirubrobacteraceae bacterium]
MTPMTFLFLLVPHLAPAPVPRHLRIASLAARQAVDARHRQRRARIAP